MSNINKHVAKIFGKKPIFNIKDQMGEEQN